MSRKVLILTTALSQQLLIIILSYTKELFPRLSEAHSLRNSIIQITVKEIILIPLFVLIIYNYRKKKSLYAKLMLAGFAVIVIADACIVTSVYIGVGTFLLVHLINSINFTLLFRHYKNMITILDSFMGICIMGISLALYFFILYPALTGSIDKVGILVYTLIMGYSVWRACILYRPVDITFFISVSAGAFLFFICDFQIAHSVIVLKKDAGIWSNNVIYYTGLYLLALSTVFQLDNKEV